MKLSVSLIVTSIIASAAAAATPVMEPVSTSHVLVYREGDDIARGSCGDNDTECKSLENSKKFTLEIYRKAWGQMITFAKDLEEVCGWNWFDGQYFETKKAEWTTQLADIEKYYKGRLPGLYNLDQEIADLRSRYEGINRAVQVRQSIKDDKRCGVEDIASIFELAPMINSFDFFNILKPNPEIKSRIEYIDSKLREHNKNVLENTDMDQKLRTFYTSQAKKVEKLLNELKERINVTL